RRGDVIPVAKELLDDKRTWPRRSHLIFPTMPCHTTLQADLRAAQIPGRGNWHRFRKARATHLLMSGMRCEFVSKLLRHKNVNTTMALYVKIEIGQLVDALGVTHAASA
ncbi:MAG: tyrosine-type recombinase/integrase, partial [Phycisphaerae bacterium]|nr:tyrosine-type recombinase/integrase [Phycisphaerae bacterium]